jgi:membrane-associated phospholipid phosphatase
MIRPRDWSVLGACALATLVVCAALMAWIDQPLALFMARFRDTRFVAAFEIITNLANSAIWYSVALTGMVLAWRAWRRAAGGAARALYQRRLRAAVYVIASMVVSGLVVNGLKLAVGRSRPKMFVYKNIADFAPFHRALDDCSFPSGHAQSIWAAMIALAWIFPRWRAPFFAVAVVVSASRVIIGVHYASDVVAGAFFAFAVAFIMRRWFERDGVPLALAPLTAD